MTMTDLLIRGADVIDRNGFIGDDYYEGETYQPNVPCRVCPRAALAIASGRHPLFVESWPLQCESLTEQTEEERAAYEEIVAAETCLARYLREEQGYHYDGSDSQLIEAWAEELGRTQTQVVGALRAAAEYDVAGQA